MRDNGPPTRAEAAAAEAVHQTVIVVMLLVLFPLWVSVIFFGARTWAGRMTLGVVTLLWAGAVYLGLQTSTGRVVLLVVALPPTVWVCGKYRAWAHRRRMGLGS